MPQPHILIERTHTLGLPAARQCAHTWAEKARIKFGVTCHPTNHEQQHVLRFSGHGIDGQLCVTATTLQLEATLSLLTAMFQPHIEAKLNAQFDKMLAGTGTHRT